MKGTNPSVPSDDGLRRRPSTRDMDEMGAIAMAMPHVDGVAVMRDPGHSRRGGCLQGQQGHKNTWNASVRKSPP